MEANKILEQAKAWLGKNEKDGTHKEIIDIYNSHKPLARGYKVKYTDSWCATFVSAVAIVCGAADIIPLECSCGQMITKAQQMGIWVENDAYVPKPADIILYDWDDKGSGDNTGWPDHIGIVESVYNGLISVIEGNNLDAVGYRALQVNGKTIRGYICPKYEAEKEPVKTEDNTLYYPKYTGTSNSLVDALKSLKIDSSKAYRTQIANANGIKGYTGKASENTMLLNLLKEGKLFKCDAAQKEAEKPVKTVKYYAKYTGTSNSLVDALKSRKIDSSFTHRKQIAKANGISAYVGLATQNTKLLNLLKQGKLIKE